MKSDLLELDTASSRFLDLTQAARRFLGDVSDDGLLHVFAPHATAGIALIETGSGTERDLEQLIDRILPPNATYVHSHGSPGHGRDHVLPALVAPSLTVPVIEGELQLGTWQSIVFVDTNRDNPRRKVRLSFVRA